MQGTAEAGFQVWPGRDRSGFPGTACLISKGGRARPCARADEKQVLTGVGLCLKICCRVSRDLWPAHGLTVAPFLAYLFKQVADRSVQLLRGNPRQQVA